DRNRQSDSRTPARPRLPGRRHRTEPRFPRPSSARASRRRTRRPIRRTRPGRHRRSRGDGLRTFRLSRPAVPQRRDLPPRTGRRRDGGVVRRTGRRHLQGPVLHPPERPSAHERRRIDRHHRRHRNPSRQPRRHAGGGDARRPAGDAALARARTGSAQDPRQRREPRGDRDPAVRQAGSSPERPGRHAHEDPVRALRIRPGNRGSRRLPRLGRRRLRHRPGRRRGRRLRARRLTPHEPHLQENTMPLTLDTYRQLGRSGLRVSPLALGTATFGNDWGWGAEKDEARRLFDLYVERGGNFFDTAVTYTNGTSERMLGEFARDRRDGLVLATKYTTLRRPDDPNSGGASRKSLFGAVETSLRQLNTDYIDLLYLHVWDDTTPV